MDLAPVVQKLDSTIRWINLYPVDHPTGFPNTYPLDSDLSSGQHYPPFEQLGPASHPEEGGWGGITDTPCCFTVQKPGLVLAVRVAHPPQKSDFRAGW